MSNIQVAADKSDDFYTRLMTAWLAPRQAVQHHDINTKLTEAKENKRSKAGKVNKGKKEQKITPAIGLGLHHHCQVMKKNVTSLICWQLATKFTLTSGVARAKRKISLITQFAVSIKTMMLVPKLIMGAECDKGLMAEGSFNPHSQPLRQRLYHHITYTETEPQEVGYTAHTGLKAERS